MTISRPNRKFPDITCPAIDDLISAAEDLRTNNEILREWADYWRDKFDELETDSQCEIEALKNELDQLR